MYSAKKENVITKLDERDEPFRIDWITGTHVDALAKALARGTHHTAVEWGDTIIVALLKQVGHEEYCKEMLGA